LPSSNRIATATNSILLHIAHNKFYFYLLTDLTVPSGWHPSDQTNKPGL